MIASVPPVDALGSIPYGPPTAFRVVTEPLWDGPPPFGDGARGADEPRLTAYLPSVEINTRHAMLTFPGGAYGFLSERSGREYGERFAARFVVNGAGEAFHLAVQLRRAVIGDVVHHRIQRNIRRTGIHFTH